jgi:hypothetical protein
MHPHLKEEIELQEYLAMGPGHHDREEAINGARWNNNWKDEYILSDRDVWYRNPLYCGPEGLHPEDDMRYEEEEDQESFEKYQRELSDYYQSMTQIEWAEQIIGEMK